MLVFCGTLRVKCSYDARNSGHRKSTKNRKMCINLTTYQARLQNPGAFSEEIEVNAEARAFSAFVYQGGWGLYCSECDKGTNTHDVGALNSLGRAGVNTATCLVVQAYTRGAEHSYNRTRKLIGRPALFRQP